MIKLLKNHYHKNYHGIYQHAKKLFVFDLALLLLAFAMLVVSVFLFLWKPSLADQIDMSISLGGERIKSGEEIHLTIDYTNKSKYKLNDVSLGLHLPEGFIIDRNKTAPDVFSENSTFISLKELKAGATGQADVYGWFWSEPNKDTQFIANLSYQPENNNMREQKLASFVARLPDSILTGQLNISSSTLPNVPLKFTYTLTNSGDRTISNISVTNNWNANVMNAKDATNISIPAGGIKVIEGQLITPNQSGNFSFSLTPQILVNNHLISLAPSVSKLQIFAPQITSGARLLKNLDYAEPGQMLPIEISWENKGGFKLQNLTLHLASNLTGVVDWAKTAKENGGQLEKNGIYFDSSSRTNLSNGNPNSADTFTVNVYLLSNFDLPQLENVSLEIYPVVKAEAGPVSGQAFNQDGSRIRIPLATEVDFSNVETRYYTSEGDQLGRGPLPPQVGKTTKYWVFVKILNTTNALNSAVFGTSLPDGIEFTGKQSTSVGPQLDYNASSRAITWKYDTLPANSQTGLYFEVSVKPTGSQIGQNIPLTNSLQFSATDDFINKKFEFSHPSLNNVLNSNDSGHGAGSKVE